MGIFGLFGKKEKEETIDRKYYIQQYYKALYETSALIFKYNQSEETHKIKEWRLMEYDWSEKGTPLEDVPYPGHTDYGKELLEEELTHTLGIITNGEPSYSPAYRGYRIVDMTKWLYKENLDYKFVAECHMSDAPNLTNNTLFYAKNQVIGYLGPEELVGYFFENFGDNPMEAFCNYIEFHKKNFTLRPEDIEAEKIIHELFHLELPEKHKNLVDSRTAIRNSGYSLYGNSEFMKDEADSTKEE